MVSRTIIQQQKNAIFMRTNIIHHYAFIFMALTIILLTSCSHVSRKDGPPNFYVDVSKIPDAVPKQEPLSKYGNMPTYRVYGKRYYTLKSSRNYEAVGVASWYGTKFHAVRTSSGEPYNMLGMTAAHKTLPLPTYVEVTNLKNNRKVIVKVNDRGPFSGSRLIDLSYVAAKKLDMVGHGTTYVKVKAIDINPFRFRKEKPFYFSPPTPPSHPVEDHTYASSYAYDTKPTAYSSKKQVYLQVGAFRQKSHAIKLQEQLINLIKAPVEISHSSNSAFYKVKVGPINDIALLDNITDRLKELGISPNKV